MRKEIFLSVREFCQRTSLGKTKVYQMIDEGVINSIKVGRRRLILSESLDRIVDVNSLHKDSSDAAA